MNLLDKFNPVKAAIAPYWLWIKIGIVVAIVALILWQRHRINSLKEERELYQAAVKGYEQAQTINLENIGNLKGRIDAMVESRRLEREASDAAVTAAKQEEEKINAELATTKQELSNVYARIPSARKWADTGVDAAVADRLPGGARAR